MKLQLAHVGLRLPVLAIAAAALIVRVDAVSVGAGGQIRQTVQTNWAQWRGPGGQGVSDETALPIRWSATENVRWKTAIPGLGHSSPIVWGDRVFLTTAIEGPIVPGAGQIKHIIKGEEYLHPDSCCGDRSYTLKVVALDRDTGRIVWDRTAYEGTVYDRRHKLNTYASSTPITDGRRVYAYFEAEGLYAYDFSGALAWKTSLGKITKAGFGHGTSPVLHGDLLILLADQLEGEGSFIAAVHRDTGREVWRTPRTHRRSYATPVIVRTAGGVDEVIASGSESTVAYDPATGRERWRGPGVAGRAYPSPVVMNDLVIMSASVPERKIIAVRAGGTGDITGTASVLWNHNRGTAYVVSPILYKGLVYVLTDGGIITCLDAATGEIKYQGGRVPVPDTFFASPVAFDDTILLTSQTGDTYVVQAGPVHKVLHTNSIGEPVFASIAISQGRLFIRGARHLYAIGHNGR
jgi:outer membrane protein assembly factor BamB